MHPAPALILVIDDEPQIRRVVRNALEGEGVRVIEAAGGREGIDRAAAELPDLIVLDLGLPDLAGASVCAELRRWTSAPIVVLSARHSEHEKVALLDAGADDYVTKPFSTRELVARVQAQLRRARAQRTIPSDVPVEAGELSIDLARRVATRAGERLRLTPIEWNILRALVLAAGRTLTHRQIFDAVWGRSPGDPQQYLRVHITNLRRKLEPNPRRPAHLLTVYGMGYKLVDGDAAGPGG